MPTADPRIRAATPADAETLSRIALRAKAHWGYSTELITLWADDLRVSPESCDGRSVWLLESEGFIAGFGEVLTRDGYAILDDLWTDPPYMGKGIGKALFRHLCAVAADAGAERICLESDPFAQPFYRAHGSTYRRRGAIGIGTRPHTSPHANRPPLALTAYNLYRM